MKTFPFYYPVFSNRGRKGRGGAPTDRSPRPLLRTRGTALLGTAIAAVGLTLAGTQTGKAQSPTPPPVVTPAAVPGGVTVVAPAGSVVAPAGNVVRPVGGVVTPSSTPVQVSGGTVLPPSSGIRQTGPSVVPSGTVIRTNGPTVVPGGPGPGAMNDSRYSVGGPQAQTPGTTPPPVAVQGGAAIQGNATVTANGVVVTNGVVDAYEPGTRFVVRETAGPVSYTYSPQTAYYSGAGQQLTAEQVRTRIRAGLPVRMEYLPQGNTRVIQRVVVEDRYLND